MAGDTTRFGAGQAVGSVELCDRVFMTDGDSTYDEFPVGPVLEELGPRIVELAVHGMCREKSNAFKYKVQAEMSYDGHTWVNVGDVLSEQTTEGYEIAIYDSRTKLGRFLRFLVCANDAGGSERARVAVTLYWRYAT